jgi:hypothetical protein
MTPRTQTRRQGDKETRIPERPGLPNAARVAPQMARSIGPRSLSACLLVSLSPCLLVFLLASGCLPTTPKTDRGIPYGSQENSFEQACAALQRSTDYATCRSALAQVNQHRQTESDPTATRLSPEQKQLLEDPKQFALDAADLAEVENADFTALDGRHLELCFLMRDAARSLAPGDAPREQAEAAFAWAVRQVGAREAAALPLPPQFVLYRGWGTSLERALVYLSLLEQLGYAKQDGKRHKEELFGCLVGPAETADEKPGFWWCGVVVGKEVYLFDPRLGLPLPGPDGKGVATLAEVRAHPELLRQLDGDTDHGYDVTAEQVKTGAVYVAPGLSSLAPRFRPLQDRLQGGSVEVGLPDPFEALARVKSAAGADVPVRVWKAGVGVQRHFWPTEEGGVDVRNHLVPQVRALVPWQKLLELNLPEFDRSEAGVRLQGYFAFASLDLEWAGRLIEINDIEAAKKVGKDLEDVQHAQDERRQRLQKFLSRPFADFPLNPGMPREQLLRGQFREATQELVATRTRVREQRARLGDASDLLNKEVRPWWDDVLDASGRFELVRSDAEKSGVKNPLTVPEVANARAVLDKKWANGALPLGVLLDGKVAEARGAEITYELALCMHELAERRQAGVDRLRRAGKPVPEAEAKAAEKAWRDALNWWDNLSEDRPVPELAAAARLHAARAHEALGHRDDAVRLLEDLSGVPAGPQQVARLYLAKRLKQ